MKKTMPLFIVLVMYASLLMAQPADCSPPATGTFVCNENNTQAQIIELRDRILEEAENARTACDDADNTAEIRASLSVLVDELIALVPQRTEAEKAEEVAGGWFQVWSDNPFTTVPNICFDTFHIYQIVSLNGYYYNISQVNAFGSSLGYFIRGIYELGENALPVEFTDAYFSNEPLPTGMDLVALTDQAENGEIMRAQIPPTPVIGITGTLGNIYVDDLLRIITDGTPASGNSDLYIMRRQNTVQ